ncbi:MAG: 3-oxoacyl-[acyl-carrier protein] reductase [Flavobacteriales bacterium]|jgi:3-oxoacyl-[acyl-carrier protein] reductase
MNLSLSGKTAIVCGSTQGIGLAAAQELASLGAQLILIARNEEKLKTVIGSFTGKNHRYIVADFSKPEELDTILQEKLVETELHILVNNTGGPAGGLIYQAKPSEFINTFNQHLICNHIMVQHVWPKMKVAGYGRIINVISTSVKQPLGGLGVSNTIRGAVASWSKTLANELGQYNITVNNVLPGATATGRLDEIITNKADKTGQEKENILKQMASAVPMNRIAQPNEVANAIAFLASPAASYINGINVPVDGGRTGCL